MPRVSVIIPAYRAGRTLPRCLACLEAQTFRDFETIVLDSGEEPSLETGLQLSPRVRRLRYPLRLMPHTASNRAAAAAAGELLVFLDADAYPKPDWLARLVAAWDVQGGVLMGSVGCFGRRWIDRSAHLCKFDKWLPGGRPRPLTEAATVDLLIASVLFQAVGPFLETTIHADTDLSWRLGRAKIPLSLIPSAMVEHHHLHGLATLCRERFLRGRGYADMWRSWNRPTHLGLAWRVAVSVLPLRLASQCLRVLRHAWSAGERWGLLTTMPAAAAGLYAWLLGEARQNLGHLFATE